MDRIGVIKGAALNLRDLIVDASPASLTGTSLDFARLIQPVSGQLKGREAYCYSGAGAGQSRISSDFLPANNRLIFDQSFASIPSTNSAFLVLDYWTKDDYDNALNRKIGIARLKYLQEQVATLQLVATQYEYPVPSGMDYIETLRLVPSGSSDYQAGDYVDSQFEFPTRYWNIEVNPLGTRLIVFDARKLSLDAFNEDWVRVIGQVKPVIGATDNATVPADLEEYLIQGVSLLLSSQRLSETQEWRLKFSMFRDMDRELENYIFRHRRGRQVL